MSDHMRDFLMFRITYYLNVWPTQIAIIMGGWHSSERTVNELRPMRAAIMAAVILETLTDGASVYLHRLKGEDLIKFYIWVINSHQVNEEMAEAW